MQRVVAQIYRNWKASTGRRHGAYYYWGHERDVDAGRRHATGPGRFVFAVYYPCRRAGAYRLLGMYLARIGRMAEDVTWGALRRLEGSWADIKNIADRAAPFRSWRLLVAVSRVDCDGRRDGRARRGDAIVHASDWRGTNSLGVPAVKWM